LYKDRYYQLDEFSNILQGLILVEAYLDYDISSLLPPWLNLVDVTQDKRYSMFELASIEKMEQNEEMIKKLLFHP
jgi:CYTH domain-containing protein